MTGEDQSRLQEHGVDTGAAPVDDPAARCERCASEVDGGEGVRHLSEIEQMAGVADINRSRKRDLCEACFKLEKYLDRRYNELIRQPQNRGAVAVFCDCHDPDEVDVHPLRRYEPIGARACSRCGSSEVIIEELPVTAPGLEEVRL